MDPGALAKILWNYNKLDHQLKKSDLILVLGSHDIRVAEHAARLFLDGWAPMIAFSGGFGRLTGDWTRPEADMFADAAAKLGVPKANMLIEDRSTNTGENIDFTKELLREKGIDPKQIILVQKPYMERRAFATFKKRWPGKDVIVSSPDISFDEYPNHEISKDEMINIIVGDTQRIKLYPAKGFQVEQDMPDEVWRVYEQLVALGFTKYVLPEK